MSGNSKSFYELAERALALAREGKNIIRLNVGNTALPVPEEARAALARSAANLSSGYGPAAGSETLRDAIAEREGCTREEIVVGPGSKFLIFALLSILRRRGGDFV